MSFQAYLDNIKTKTGKTPADFLEEAKKKGLVGPDIKANQIFEWLKQDYDVGLGHARAIWHLMKPHMK